MRLLRVIYTYPRRSGITVYARIKIVEKIAASAAANGIKLVVDKLNHAAHNVVFESVTDTLSE